MRAEWCACLILALLLIGGLLFASAYKPVGTVSESPLADQIDACAKEIASWQDLVNIGVVLHRSNLSDFDAWISNAASAHDWKGVLTVKRYAEQAGYSSVNIDSAVKVALSNMSMFKNYSLPITDATDPGYFWPGDRFVLYGYRYAEELNWETAKWNKTSGFLALKSVRNWYGSAFFQCNPDLPTADALFGTRWHEAGGLMDCFFIFYQLSVDEALHYAVQEWDWLNSRLWSKDHFSYSVLFPGWEFSGASVFPNAAKLNLKGTNLRNWSRVMTDMEFRYVNNTWNSPQWQGGNGVTEHYDPANPEQRLDGTLGAWLMLDTFYGLFTAGNQTNMRDMLDGIESKREWLYLNDSALRQRTSNSFRLSSTSAYSNDSTAMAALCLFLLGISPQEGRGLAIPLISDRHNDYASLNYRHFEFDYANHRIKIPLWGGSTLKFMYGEEVVTEHFVVTGIYSVTFAADWNSISQVTWVSNLYPSENYLWEQDYDRIQPNHHLENSTCATKRRF